LLIPLQIAKLANWVGLRKGLTMYVAAIEKYRSLIQLEDKAAAMKVAGKTFSEDELRQFLAL